jgi:hypothetical protein
MEFENVFHVLRILQHDEDYDPAPDWKFLPTFHAPGSSEKIDVLCQRVRDGQPLWHKDDETCCTRQRKEDAGGYHARMPKTIKMAHSRKSLGSD